MESHIVLRRTRGIYAHALGRYLKEERRYNAFRCPDCYCFYFERLSTDGYQCWRCDFCLDSKVYGLEIYHTTYSC